MAVTPVSLELWRNLLGSVADEMGVTLGRTAYSANMKERRDYSCAVFDAAGVMVAQAAHIPVHLGAMTASVRAALDHLGLSEGDVAILNDPYLGGTHLPDVSLIAPVFVDGELAGYVANRGHHADIGGMAPGSLPVATELVQEGVIIPPLLLIEQGVMNDALMALICRNTRTPEERQGDFAAQLAAVRTGQRRLEALARRYGLAVVHEHMAALLDYAEALTRAALRAAPEGSYRFEDAMDDDGVSGEPKPIVCTARIADGYVTFDFTGTAQETEGCVNTPLAVTESAALYAVRCVVGGDMPQNDGVRRAVGVDAPSGSLVNANPPHAVSGGNVETSQRITDVLFGCLAQALPNRTPAASQGTMNNVLVGGRDPRTGRTFTYYETTAGGMGGGPSRAGAAAVHSHMTNTLNTPIEAMEFAFPLRLRRYAVRRGSGGAGRNPGGDGIVRELEFLSPAKLTVISERRESGPYGLAGGGPGAPGANELRRADGKAERVPAKATLDVGPGDVFSVSTPGGGGWGAAK
ncbi:MAG: hydantoinase B/oxoprolinase family protein [Chloroflexota bacterium]|nr:hydantoinase B/oxoprolinase family protein [Chloroflexota bacterium]